MGLIIALVLLVVLFVVFLPILAIWALNVLFGLTIVVTLKTWFAAFVLIAIVAGGNAIQ